MQKVAFFMYFPLKNPNQCESVSCLVKPRSPVDREYYVPCAILSVTVRNQDHWTGFCRTMRGKYITYLPHIFYQIWSLIIIDIPIYVLIDSHPALFHGHLSRDVTIFPSRRHQWKVKSIERRIAGYFQLPLFSRPLSPAECFNVIGFARWVFYPISSMWYGTFGDVVRHIVAFT